MRRDLGTGMSPHATRRLPKQYVARSSRARGATLSHQRKPRTAAAGRDLRDAFWRFRHDHAERVAQPFIDSDRQTAGLQTIAHRVLPVLIGLPGVLVAVVIGVTVPEAWLAA
jgi:hypothetical protein